MSGLEVSVVICTYDRVESLRHALGSALAQATAIPYEVIVVDDGPDDATQAAVSEFASNSPIRLAYFATETGHHGVAAARNKGVSEARGRWVVFLDDDEAAPPDWLEKLRSVALECDAACVGGSIVVELPECIAARLGPVCRSLLGEHRYTGMPTPFFGTELPSSGNLLVERPVFDAVGLFDESISAGEDTEFLDRVREAGFLVWSAPDAVVFHCISEHRLRPDYLKWVSLRWGKQFAEIDASHRGRGQAVLNTALRLGKSVFVTLPHLLQASVHGDDAAALDQRCLLWRTEGYMRKCLHCCAPNVFPQTRFWHTLDFREERTLFSSSEVTATHDAT